MEPVTREYLRGLRYEIIEKTRIYIINRYVSHIYKEAIQVAKTTRETSYVFNFEKETQTCGLLGDSSKDVLKFNIQEILNKLRALFKDCYVEYRIIPSETPQKYLLGKECIIVDWF